MDTPAFWIVVTGILVAASCGFIGSFLILRQMAMLGDAISHSVLLGLVVAFLLTHSTGALPMFIGAVVAGLFTSFVVQTLSEGGVQEDAAIGVTFTALFALGVVLLSVYAGRVHLDVEHVLYGEIAYVPWDILEVGGRDLGPRAVWIVGGVFLLSLMVVGIWFKEFKICAFDPGLAAAFGIPVGVFHYTLMTLVSLTTVAAFENVGAILSVAMLIAPGATAYLLTDRFERMLLLSVVVGALSAVGGYGLAAAMDASIAGAMTTVAGILFALAFLFSPSHGVVVRRWVRTAPQTLAGDGSPPWGPREPQ